MKLKNISIQPEDEILIIILKQLYEDTYILEHDRFGEIGEILGTITNRYGVETANEINNEVLNTINTKGH